VYSPAGNGEASTLPGNLAGIGAALLALLLLGSDDADGNGNEEVALRTRAGRGCRAADVDAKFIVEVDDTNRAFGPTSVSAQAPAPAATSVL
jgi:hypothetical protein